MTNNNYPRDLIGYGKNPPNANWPGGARVALQFVLNYEEGGENCVLHGDAASEQFLSEIIGAAAYPARHMSMEGIYEYGSRAGVWRILREFEKRGLPLTIFGVSMALQRHPDVTQALLIWARKSPATAGAGSTTRTSTKPPSASTCAPASRSSAS